MNDFAVQFIRYANFDFFVARKHVHFRERNFRRALATNAVTGRNDIEGPYSSGSARSRAVLAAEVTELGCLFAEIFRRERTFPYAGGVRFHNAHGIGEL